jgi:tetratricopeptide (TPR) repeat protein
MDPGARVPSTASRQAEMRHRLNEMSRVVAFLFVISALAAAQTYEGLFDEAATLAARGDFGGAATKFEAALRLRPDAVEALSNLSVMYYSVQRWQDAEAAASKALRARPELKAAKLIRGLSLVRLNRSAEAIEPLKEIVAADPNNRDALLGLGSSLVATGELEKATEVYERRVVMAPRDADVWYALGICYERLAEATSQSLSQLVEGRAWGKRLLGEYWLERGEQRLAREAFTEALTLDPQQAGLAERLAISEVKGEVQPESELPLAEAGPGAALYNSARALASKARRAFEKFTELAPSSWQAQLLLGDIHRQKRDFPSAIRYYENAGRLRPDSPWALGLGTVYWELADDDNAIVYLQKAIGLNPKSTIALFALGNIAVKQRRDEEAVRLLEACLRLDKGHLGAQADLGKAYLRLGNYGRAVPLLEAARRIDTYGEIHFQLSQALRKLGRAEAADGALLESKRVRQAQQEREQRLRLGR